MSSYYVSSGVTSTGLYLSDGDDMYVFFDGKADNTTLDTYGHLTVYSGGVADRTTHTGWESYFTVDQGGLASRTTLTVGYLDVYDGGVADDVDIISGVLYVTSGGTATGVKWTPCTGAYHVESGGTVTFASSYSGVYYGSDFQLLSSAATMDGMKLTSGCTMCVMDGGVAKDTEASDFGTVNVYSGGVASNTTLMNYGYMRVSSGGSAHEVSVTAAGLYISFDGKADAVAVHGNGFLEISGGGVADGVTVSSAGSVWIGEGGVAKNVIIEKGGSMDIGNGGAATGVVWTPCEGVLRIGNGAQVTFASEYSGVYYGGGKSHELLSNAASMDGKSIASGYEMHVMNGGVANDAALSYMGRMDVYSGGVANSPVLNDYGYMYVHSGGVVNDAAVNSGYLRIYSGGVASKAVLDGNGHVEVLSGGTAKDTVVSGAGGYSSGILLVSSGGTAQGVSVKPYGSVEVESGGTATGIDWTPCVGRVAVYEGGSATFVSEYSGVYYGAEEQLLSSAGTMEGKELGYHYRMYVMNGGAANNAILSSGGSLWISSGGVANNTTVNSGGYIWIYSGGTASMGVVSSGGVVDVGSGGVARDMTICGRTGGLWNSGTIRVNSGGTAVDTTVSSGGQLTVYAGGVASNVTVKYNGSIYLNGKVTGRMNFEYGAVVSANEAYGSPVLDFDLTQTTAGADALVTTLSVINGTPKYTLTVAGTEADGTYKLAADAYGFDKTISVVDTSGTELGTLAVDGGTQELDGEKYTLTMDEFGTLMVIVGDPTPPNGPEEPLNDYLYDKKKNPPVNADVKDAYGTYLTEAGQEVWLDQNGSIDHDGYHNRIEKAVKGETRDTADYAKIVLEHGAKLSFHAEATAAATFTVYNLVYNEKKDTYSLKKLQTLKLADKDKDGIFTADSKKPVELPAAGEYYVSMQYADKRKDVSEAYYNVSLNGADKGTEFFLDDDDGWNNWLYDKKKTPADNSANLKSEDIDSVGDSIQLDKKCYVDGDNFVGFGDDTDFVKFSLNTAANLSLNLNGVGAAADVKNSGALKVVIYSFNAAKMKMTSLQTTSVKAADLIAGTANTKLKLLEAGDYYVSVKSTNAKKGDQVYYNMSVGSNTVFFTDGDGWNDYVYDKKKTPAVNEYVVDGAGFTVRADNKGETVNLDYDAYSFRGKDYTGFVGHNDATDFVKLNVSKAGTASFKVVATDAAKIEIWSFDPGTNKMKSLQSTALKKTEVVDGVQMYGIDTKAYNFKEAGEYYLAITSTNAKTGGNAFYNVTLLDTDIVESASLESALAMPDSLGFGQYDANSLADASAWQSLLA